MRITGTGQSTLREAAVAVLRRNDLGAMTSAAPVQYPHQWSFDSGFVAIGLSRVDIPRALTELRGLLAAQWSTGMIPHIVFVPGANGYFPGADRWGTRSAAARPRGLHTSGICQPPVQAIALQHLLDRARENGGSDLVATEAFLVESFDGWLAWHRWLAAVRDPDGVGLVEIYHGLESGFDDSPRWDGSYQRIRPDGKPAADPRDEPVRAGHRSRSLWLIDQMRAVGFDDERMRHAVDFRVHDVFFSAVLAAASEALAYVGEEIGRSDAIAELREIAARFREGVAATVDPATGLARDLDARTGEWIAPLTVAGFAPLVAGGPPEMLSRQRTLIVGEQWMGHGALRYPLPPSTSPASPDFRRRIGWRGPVWPFLNLLLGWASARDSAWDLRGVLRDASLEQLSDLRFGEYYEPLTGEPLGSENQAWTAAAALEWLG